MPEVTEKGRPLSQCAQGLLRKFLEDGPYWRDRDRGFGIIDKVQLYSGIPDLIKKYAVVTPDAFTYGNNVWFRDGIDPGNLDNFSGLVLLAHEFAHNLQYDSASDAAVVFGALYLARSGTVYLQGKDPYTDNHYEVQAREFEAAFAKWLEKEYGKEDPCKKFRGGK